MKKGIFYILFIFIVCHFLACQKDISESKTEKLHTETFFSEEKAMNYTMISMSEAQTIFATEGEYIILDVREQDEYSEGHIPGAICIPHGAIAEKTPVLIPDKDVQIYVYCRSGRRSKIASDALVKAGYVNVTEIGGILDYTGEIVRD